jgi:hypothetical protein
MSNQKETMMDNPFQAIDLSARDEANGQILNSLQKAVLQNQRAAIATQKINLVFTPNDVLSYTQQEAFLKGQLDLIEYLLDASLASEEAAATPQD